MPREPFEDWNPIPIDPDPQPFVPDLPHDRPHAACEQSRLPTHCVCGLPIEHPIHVK